MISGRAFGSWVEELLITEADSAILLVGNRGNCSLSWDLAVHTSTLVAANPWAEDRTSRSPVDKAVLRFAFRMSVPLMDKSCSRRSDCWVKPAIPSIQRG